jgi:hypothetical protein
MWEVDMKTSLAVIGAAAAGAGLMYVADPRLGRRRRALLRDALMHGARVATRSADIGGRDITHRVKGIIEETKGMFRDERVDDAVLVDRVRTEVGRFSSHPNVEVIVRRGFVTLLGPVVVSEEEAVLRAAESVKGVCGVNNRMWTYEPNMQTQVGRERQLDILQRHWAPATRIVVGAAGASAIASGAKTGGAAGAALALAGLTLVARSVFNIAFGDLFSATADLPRRGTESLRKLA